MRFESRFIVALLFSATAFALTGGVRATEQAIAAEEGTAPAETSIPFVNMGGIRDWKAIDDQTLYVQDAGRKWYIARLAVPCPDLPFAQRIGFETRGLNQLDRFSSVVVAGQRYPLTSFVASGPPPSGQKQGGSA